MTPSLLERYFVKQKYQKTFLEKNNCALLLCKNDQYSTIIEANSAFYRLIGYSPEEMSSLFNNRFASLVIDDVNQLLQKISSSLQDNSTLDYEFRIQNKQGQTLWIHDIATYDKSLDCFFVVIMDITYRQNALDSIVKTTSIDNLTFWLSSLIDNIPNPIAIFKQQELVLSNKTFQTLSTQVVNTDAVGQESFTELVCSLGQIYTHADANKELIRTFANRTYRIKQRDIPHPIEDVTFSMVIFDDVSALKENEAALTKAIDARSQFLAVVSHELRTPLSAMIGLMKLLDNHIDSNEGKELLASSIQSAQRLDLHVNDILDFSKIEAEQLQLNIQPVNILKELSRTLRSFETECFEKNISFILDWQPTPFEVTHLDWLRTNQIYTNVLNNALKFTSDGRISVRIQLEASRLDIQVIDSGCGMSQEQLDSLYTPFIQGERNINRCYGGTGLGLSISKSLVELMRGHIHVSSQINLGTSVSISIPCVSTTNTQTDYPDWYDHWLNEKWRRESAFDDGYTNLYPDQLIQQVPTISNKDNQLTVKQVNLEKLNILAVDDDPINRLLLSKQLNSLGVNYKTFSSADELVDFLSTRDTSVNATPVDMIITDIHMPHINGYQLTEQVRKIVAYQDLPVIGFTADNSKEVATKARAAGINEMIFKPCSIEMFQALFERHCLPVENESTF
ncbi:hybrid sensor histidine kinase/response regulator [Vibrio fluminensis]|uniref:hybrid sensor histidine kinase/response regulator n=1 Tax=Vibrio fluminensis TaxID=2783614 RepID=UPI00188891CE|nr:hybrid sensor histidine kinase/response regulator [Vibrio fluminensis]